MMDAIEFTAIVNEGKIAVPESNGLRDGQIVRVLILIEETKTASKRDTKTREEFWKRTEGAWQGETLVRDDQGDYPIRLELE